MDEYNNFSKQLIVYNNVWVHIHMCGSFLLSKSQRFSEENLPIHDV